MHIYAHNTMSIQNGGCPLLLASQEGHDKTVEILLQAGATVDLPDKVESYYSLLWENGVDSDLSNSMALHTSCETRTSIDNLTSMLVSMLS